MISCVILSFYMFTHYPFSYLTVIFTRKDFIQLNHKYYLQQTLGWLHSSQLAAINK